MSVSADDIALYDVMMGDVMCCDVTVMICAMDMMESDVDSQMKIAK